MYCHIAKTCEVTVGHSINSGLDTFSDKKKTEKTANH